MIQFLLSSCPWWVNKVLCGYNKSFGGKKHWQIFHKLSWPCKAYFTSCFRLMLFTIRAQQCLWCRLITWSNSADALFALALQGQIGKQYCSRAVLFVPSVTLSNLSQSQKSWGAINTCTSSARPRWALGCFVSIHSNLEPDNFVRSQSASKMKCVKSQELKDIWHS